LSKVVTVSLSKTHFLVLGMARTGQAVATWLRSLSKQVTTFDDNPTKGDIHTLGAIAWGAVEVVVQSPGVPFSFPSPHPVTAMAQRLGVPVVSDVYLWRQAHPHNRFVGITGTNGKSTTTALVGHILAKAGYAVAVGGNIGSAVTTLPELGSEGIYVLELSSFQLEVSPPLNLTAAGWLNIAEDHLDRHGTLENYIEAKKRIFAGASHAFICGDDEYSRAVATTLEGCHMLAATDEKPFDYALATRLPGAHNSQNISLAYNLCKALGVAEDDIREGIISFPGLEHRLEQVGHIGPVTFVNDSKATNADAASRALTSFPGKRILWIAGGKPKTDGIEPLKEYFPTIHKAYFIGQAQARFAQTAQGLLHYMMAGTLEVAVRNAFEDAQKLEGESIILLSPACASFDQFKDFEERGTLFKKIVKTILNGI
jgi:UDP-N-acetylmuramoylalanine--D-glutamate ligase